LTEHHEIELYDIETIHNPIRAERVDGVEIDDHEDNGVVLRPEFVDIPMADVVHIAESMRPTSTPQWRMDLLDIRRVDDERPGGDEPAPA
jgi:hypothetical protein